MLRLIAYLIPALALAFASGCNRTGSSKKSTVSTTEHFDFPVAAILEKYKVANPSHQIEFSATESDGVWGTTIEASGSTPNEADFRLSRAVGWINRARVDQRVQEIEKTQSDLDSTRVELEAAEKMRSEQEARLEQLELEIERLKQPPGSGAQED